MKEDKEPPCQYLTYQEVLSGAGVLKGMVLGCWGLATGGTVREVTEVVCSRCSYYLPFPEDEE